MSKIQKTLTQKIMDFYGWTLFFCVYFGLIAVCVVVLDYFFEVQKIWSSWNVGWKVMACIFYGGGFSLYSWAMYFLAMKFQVLSAVLQAAMIKSKINAERMRLKILKEYEDTLNGSITVEKKIKKEKKKRRSLFKKKEVEKEPVKADMRVMSEGRIMDTFKLPMTGATGSDDVVD